jgi:hypothetical protein
MQLRYTLTLTETENHWHFGQSILLPVQVVSTMFCMFIVYAMMVQLILSNKRLIKHKITKQVNEKSTTTTNFGQRKPTKPRFCPLTLTQNSAK